MSDFQISPKTGYLPSAALDLVNYQASTFVNYYLPVVGPNALGLFSALKDELRDHPLTTDRQPVSSLLTKLNCGLAAVVDALHRLEAVGLIKSFVKQDSLGDVMVLELHPTLTPAEFINDDLLSVQLLAMVGPERFKELSDRALAQYFPTDDYKNVSHSFFTVFHPDHGNDLKLDPVVQNAKDAINQITSHQVNTNQLPKDDFDLHFVAQQLEAAGLDGEIVQAHRRLILVEHHTYGYDELVMAKLIEQAVDVVSNQFDADQFKVLARNADAKRTSSRQRSSEKSVSDLDLSGLSSEVQELIKQCEQQTPMAFLAQLKQQTNGYVSSNERYTVERLVSQSGLSNGAINLLLWYIIGEQGLGTVKANLADTIANNWGRVGVETSVDAFNEIQRHQEQQRQRQTNRRSYKSRRGKVTEKLPDWAKKDYQPEVKAASAEQIAKSKQLLAELRKKRQKKQ